ncbi:MAG: hypothetical protein JAZ05_07335 [Candidatus Thiodiazotropha taylori]|nr:hypothetical protein [Candidatus Thiodiazotropha taylori]MCW4291830.1 hypothetical protein [Candidatus Thiodiazotropha taylori]
MLFANHEPMGIALLGLNGKDQPMMEMFLKRYWSTQCIVVPDHLAKLCILDLDGIEGNRLLEKQQSEYNDRPLIVLSVHDMSIDGVRVLRKPLRTELLKQTIDVCRSEILQDCIRIEKSKPEAERIIRVSPTTKPAKQQGLASEWQYQSSGENKRRLSLPSAASQARFIESTCGKSNQKENDQPVISKKSVFYNHESNFQVILKNAIEISRSNRKPAHLVFQDGKSITILPNANQCLNAISDSKLKPRCLLKLNTDQVKVVSSDYSESQLLLSCDTNPQSLDALLWKVSLWSSRGRLPIGTVEDVNIGIRQWPNLTRMMAIPEFIRIAALWSKNPISLAKTVEFLRIETGYVYAFFSACHAMGLIQFHSSYQQHSNQTDQLSTGVVKTGFLRRILRRLQSM